ncbi:hypothetical protein TFLX_01229 [Thermoflexales bacterium]|nr:hypothetical protein TFLX_01229 [Thermoflexales bacterium]
MALVETVDIMIRSALRTEVRSEEPSPAVRDALLAAAADENPLRSVVGPSMPPLVEELQEENESAVDDWGAQVVTALPLVRRQLLLLAGQWYAVVR